MQERYRVDLVTSVDMYRLLCKKIRIQYRSPLPFSSGTVPILVQNQCMVPVHSPVCLKEKVKKYKRAGSWNIPILLYSRCMYRGLSTGTVPTSLEDNF